MKRFRPSLLIMSTVMVSPVMAHANMGPAIVMRFSIHLLLLTWIIGLGEGLLLYTLFRAWRLRSRTSRIFISMIAANVASAWLGSLFVKSACAARIMGDVTIENLTPAFWTMVYVTFVLTMIIEFPFFLVALYPQKWLVPKAAAATLLAHSISYTLLFNLYTPDYAMNMVTALEVVPASAFEMKEDYYLYFLSPDGKQVLRSDLAGNDKEVIATLVTDGVPDRLCACPRRIIGEPAEGTGNKTYEAIQRVCWECGFDLYVLLDVHGVKVTKLLLEDFSRRSAITLWDGKHKEWWATETLKDFGYFRSFGDAQKWFFNSDYWTPLFVCRAECGPEPYTSPEAENGFEGGTAKDFPGFYKVDTPFVQWSVRNGTHIAGDYGVFKLGKDQICILDPEKKRIALIARGFGPVVAKPPLAAVPEAIKEQTTN